MMRTGIRFLVRSIALAVLLLGACGSDDATSADVEGSASPAGDASDADEPAFTAQDAIDVVDAIGLAYNTYDAGLFNAVAAEDFQFVDERGTADKSTQASYFPALREGRQKGERVGDAVVVSEDPFVIAEDVLVTADFYPPEGRSGTSTYLLVVEDGELKVKEHRWTGDLL